MRRHNSTTPTHSLANLSHDVPETGHNRQQNRLQRRVMLHVNTHSSTTVHCATDFYEVLHRVQFLTKR